MSEPLLDLETYATLAVALADAGELREQLLAAHQLDEQRWNEIEADWLDRLSEADPAERGDEDSDAIPALVLAHAEAFARAQQARARAPLPLERYLELVRAIEPGRDVAEVLRRFAVDLATLLHSHRHWTVAMARDPELASRWKRARPSGPRDPHTA